MQFIEKFLQDISLPIMHYHTEKINICWWNVRLHKITWKMNMKKFTRLEIHIANGYINSSCCLSLTFVYKVCTLKDAIKSSCSFVYHYYYLQFVHSTTNHKSMYSALQSDQIQIQSVKIYIVIR